MIRWQDHVLNTDVSFLAGLDPALDPIVRHRSPKSGIFTARQHSLLYAKRCTSYRKSVRPSVLPSVRHTLVLCQSDSSYNHGVFTVG